MRKTDKLPPEPESSLQGKLKQLARMFGWRYYHTRFSIGSDRDFPDTVLCRGERLIFAELKMEGKKLRPGQKAWLDALARVPGTEAYCWRPADLDDMLRILR
jgi:hypothetical protein